MAISMCCLTPCRRWERSVAKRMPTPARGLPQILASVGQEISQELPRHFLSQSRLADEFLGQEDVCDVGGGEFVGDGDAVGDAQEVQLNPIDAEGTPPHPRGSIETRRQSNLARMQYFKQGGVYEQGL
jgi:hypothetical protein